MKKYLSLSLFIAICLMSFQSDLKLFDKGHFSQKAYHHNYLNLEIPIPENWWLRVKNHISVCADTGILKRTEFNDKIDTSIAIKDVQSAYLLMIQKNNPSLRIKRFNPSIFVIADKISNAEKPFRTVGDYLYTARRKMIQEGGEDLYKFKSGFRPISLNGKECYYMDLSVNQGTDVVKQRIIAYFEKEYAVTFALVYQTEEQRSELTRILEKAKL